MSTVKAKQVKVQNSAGTAEATLSFDGVNVVSDKPVVAQGGALTLMTAKTATGTSIDFTGIPSWVKRVTVMMSNLSTNGTSAVQVQAGSGTVQVTGYNSSGLASSSGVTPLVLSSVSGFVMVSDTAADAKTYVMVLSLVGSNLWSASHTSGGNTNRAISGSGGGSVTLSGVLDRMRITTVNGTDTFDAGTINVMYEG